MSDIESLRALLAAMEEHRETNERAEFLLDLLDRLEAVGRERDAALHGWGLDRELHIYWKARAEAAEAKVARVEALVDEWDLNEGGFADEFTEAIHENGAWRFARDLLAALDGDA